MSTKPSTTISHAVDDLFADPPVSRDIALQLLGSCIANLEATEARINRALLALFGLFIAFLAFDTGVLAKITFQGAELQRTGIVLCTVPVTMAYLYYRYASQVSFVHDLRTVIALLYKNLHESVFYGGLDMLTHHPSVRMLESYDSFRAPPSMRTFYNTTTEVVTLVLLLGPLAALVYFIVRLWNYPDIGIVLWTITTALSIVFVVRALLFGWGKHDRGEFADRRRKSESNQPHAADAK